MDIQQSTDWLLGHNNPDSNTKVLALCDFDAYSDELNFVFGEAHFGGKVGSGLSS